ncbi:uncharacterized protein UV8b_02795 [Ustilaginoidea virens]|uniref:Uncharacterized protein n=1 Tax=Ustilaginoidea virens TaxID=1159556 RepID=A0A8E5HP54_USTVR|nr:uncharacterized protein UV8b_02795 [Ustilaginoidea virens]QUC18554.1 hypothetical protein UV8b_02795 [Ustilaginoidea virens]
MLPQGFHVVDPSTQWRQTKPWAATSEMSQEVEVTESSARTKEKGTTTTTTTPGGNRENSSRGAGRVPADPMKIMNSWHQATCRFCVAYGFMARLSLAFVAFRSAARHGMMARLRPSSPAEHTAVAGLPG